MSTPVDPSMDTLINTYRELNHTVRPLDDAQLDRRGSGGTIREIVAAMRRDELAFAAALKERIVGAPLGDATTGEVAVTGLETGDDSTTVVISQFGSARGTTLSMLRELDAERWTSDIGDGTTIRDRVEALAENDRTQLAAIHEALSGVHSS